MKLFQSPGPLAAWKLDLELAIWEQAQVSVVDIRHQRLVPGAVIREYTAPSSIFLYAYGGGGQVQLDETSYQLDRFGLFHGGKGTRLSVSPVQEPLDCYMVLYRARVPLLGRRGLNRMSEAFPFDRQYALCPDHPLFFVSQLRGMHERWQAPSPLRRLSVKTSFLQLVCEIYEELASGRSASLRPDLVTMARNYMALKYNEAFSIQELAQLLHISYSHLYRMFKQQTGESPQDYLIQKRLEAVQRHLRDSNASMREIALACGFTDEHNLIRTFKSRLDMTPGEYREKMSIMKRDDGIGCKACPLYTDERIVRQFNFQDKGDYGMRYITRANLVMTAMLGITLLLSACGGGTAATNAETPASSPAPAVQSEQPTSSPQAATRIVKTVKGDVEVPANPQKVAVNWYVGDVVALGIKPVAFSGWKQPTMPFYDELDGIESLDPWEAENIMVYEPEVIVTYDAAEFDKLSKVAPTLVVEESLSPEERLAFLGEALGRETEAKAMIDAFSKKLEEAKAKLTSEQFANKTFSIMEDWGPSGDWSGVAYETSSRGGTLLYKYLGLKKPAKLEELIAENGEGRATLSYEVAHQYFGDYIFWFRQEGKESAYAKTDIWKSIPAVAGGRVLEIPGEYQGLFYYNDLGSLKEQLDYIMENINELVK
ncbi:AraC family transcriptional regulator [Paenibacillus sp. S150]|uniref:AraC family transcriptional regulator n=1 Tax=Paenibacillus sp. S150 TaxID=2749826 RepID=UPI001C57C9CD|nr:helix-turn-helix domain-containing protein [Paenibacillus sp. S150]MBW4082574.1 AraC family transcriptional regulator [Paenibacillus sp. S150]